MTTHQLIAAGGAQLALLWLVYRAGHRKARRDLQTTDGRRRYPHPGAVARLATVPQPVTVTELPTVPQQAARRGRTDTVLLRVVQ